MLRLVLYVALLLVPANALGAAPIAADQQFETASVSISPPYQEVPAGETATMTVGGQSTLGGSVFVTIPTGLDIAGEPTCVSGCRMPFVTPQSDGTQIDFTLDGETATVSFTVLVGPAVPIGTVLNVTAYLVGGPDAVEMSTAMIAVVTPAPTTEAPESVPPANGAPGDDLRLFLEVSPSGLRMAPGGEALIHIQPVRWGMWGNESPEIDVLVTVPDGLAVAGGPWCGRSDTVPEDQPCRLSRPSAVSGGTEWAITPGYDPSDGAANGVYLMVRAGAELALGTPLRVTVTATVTDVALAEAPPVVEQSVLVVAPDSLRTVDAGPNNVRAVLELRGGYTASGSSCSAGDTVSQVGAWSLGIETLYAVTSPGPGVIAEATDGSGTDVCLVPVVFGAAAVGDLTVLAMYDGTDLGPCRACVYGTVTVTRDAEVVFPVRW